MMLLGPPRHEPKGNIGVRRYLVKRSDAVIAALPWAEQSVRPGELPLC